MIPTTAISTGTLKSGLLIACDRICAARDELCALDAAAGDGDLGATLASGFTNVRESLRSFADEDIGALLSTVGVAIAGKAAGTIGFLLGGAFIRAGHDLKGVSELDSSYVAAIFNSAATSVSERGGVTPGQRTVLDAMDAAARAAANAADGGLGPIEALREAARGANAGAQATAGMEPQVGRANWIRDRAFGNLDAGAVAWAIIVDGLADGVTATN